VDVRKRIYIVEGQFDSMFIDNSVASGDASLAILAEWMKRNVRVHYEDDPPEHLYHTPEDFVLVWDNERRNKRLIQIIEKVVETGKCNVCLWPRSFIYKDINEAIIAGLPSQQITNMIDNNTYSGLRLMAEFAQWRI
jgi:hypothetical protein